MSYCTIDGIKNLFPEEKIIQLTDDENNAPSTIDPADPDCAAIIARINDAIDYADQLIDGYLRGRYTLPLSTAPSFLEKLSIDLVIFYLYGRKPELSDEKMDKMYNNAVKLLERIQAGTISLGTSDTKEAIAATGEYATNKTADDRVFSKTVLDGF